MELDNNVKSSEEQLRPSEIADEELLYRAVRPNEIVRGHNGTIEIKPQAFDDRKNRPSVDRAHMVNYAPERTRDFFGPEQGVLSLYAYQVRAISPLSDFDEKGKPIIGPQVDVEPAPIMKPPVNLAHAEICGKPHIEKAGLFKRLRLSLAREAAKNQSLILLPPSIQ